MNEYRFRSNLFLAALCGVFAVGCQAPVGSERHGKTFYLDGAGNWGWGVANVMKGLRDTGYAGDVEVFRWTTSFNPVLDHVNARAARLRAAELSRRIEDYHRRYPNNPVNIIALSAGTGVAVWAVEGLSGGASVHNLVMLSSSLSYDYEVSKALANMTGRIYVYSSPHDGILDGLHLVGTFDGKRGVEPAGLIGMQAPPGQSNRVVNISWSPQWIPYGWRGGHLDCTNPQFVQAEVARHIVPCSPAHAAAAPRPGERRTPLSASRPGAWRQHDHVITRPPVVSE